MKVRITAYFPLNHFDSDFENLKRTASKTRHAKTIARFICNNAVNMALNETYWEDATKTNTTVFIESLTWYQDEKIAAVWYPSKTTVLLRDVIC